MWRHICRLLPALTLSVVSAHVAFGQPADRVGDTYEISIESVSKTSGEMSSSSSEDHDQLVERVVALPSGGIELEFDLPQGTSDEDRVRAWQYPARVLSSPGHPLQLLNGADAKVRLQAWLGDKAQAFCGHWIFTWTAFHVDCDPESVLQTLNPLVVRANDIADGLPYAAVGSKAPAPLRAQSSSTGGSVFVAEMLVDPELLCRQRAEADVAAAEMTGQGPLTIEAAAAAHATESISGTITVQVETDAAGRLVRRTTNTQTEVANAGGIERTSTTETVRWRLIAQSP
jgi:hypothetical protein